MVKILSFFSKALNYTLHKKGGNFYYLSDRKRNLHKDTQVCIKGAVSKKEFLSAISSKLKPYYIFNSDEKTLKKVFSPHHHLNTKHHPCTTFIPNTHENMNRRNILKAMFLSNCAAPTINLAMHRLN
jgi:hypothetical protein